MLVLSRKVGEKLVVGNEVFIEVLAVSRDGVRLGIVAPRETSIHRYEVFLDIQQANKAASEAGEVTKTTVEDLAARLRGTRSKEEA
jgi:carbon storage regulator